MVDLDRRLGDPIGTLHGSWLCRNVGRAGWTWLSGNMIAHQVHVQFWHQKVYYGVLCLSMLVLKRTVYVSPSDQP